MAKPTNGPSSSRVDTGDRFTTSTASRSASSRTAPTRTTRTTSARTPGVRGGERDRHSIAGRQYPPGRPHPQPRQHPQGRDRPPWRPVNLDAGRRPKPQSPSTRRMYQRRRRSVLLAVLLVAVVALVVGQINSPESADPQQAGAGQNLAVAPAVPSAIAPTGAASSAAAAQPTTRPTATEPITTVQRTDGFAYAGGPGPVLGTAGTLRRFKVAVERGEGQNASTFAAAVERTLGDPRSWIAGRQVRWQRVAERTGAEFTIFLASAATSERMCARGGLRTARYTSCRLAGQVIINLDRWQRAIPTYGAPLSTYQAYAINHEVGHQIGYGHEACPGSGKPAPVMQQQTYGLKGCTANAWPYVGGKRYAGSPVA